MSINIVVRPKKYSIDELRELFNKFSKDDGDFEEWLSAMQITGQLSKTKVKDQFIPTRIGKVKKPSRPQYKTYEIVLAGGRSDAEFPRIGIKTLIRERTRVDPTAMTLIQYMDEKGNWVNIPEKPKLSLQKPRPSEKWRAEIVGLTGEARKKYPIKIARRGQKGTLVKVRIEGTIRRYFSRLRLWGYDVESMVSFGVTAEGKNPRDLELHCWQFPYETKGSIKSEITIIGEKSIAVMASWLEKFDIEYYNLFNSCDAAGTTTPTPGTSYDPLIKAPDIKSKIHLLDHQAKTVNPTRARASAMLPRKWYDMNFGEVAALFSLTSDDVGEARGYKGRSSDYYKLKKGQTTLDKVLKKGKEGEGF